MMASVLLLSSCASIFSKSTYQVTINSTPSNAKVSITDKKGQEVYVGSTPSVVKLKAGTGFFSKAKYQVKLSSPGYDDKIVNISSSLDGWYFGNLLLGGVLGMLIIDPATGAMWEIDTDSINETLSKSMSSIDSSLKIMDINEIPEEWKDHLVRVN
ncbi:MAG: PEGA domain-containing protein [Candidatus Kapabacteria bacterium]|nr:PEGA domain-containing protein [Candidatus Kapabacteria bacterium]